jgi:hypothetical protein
MNKQDKESFLKKNVVMYAKKIRDIQKNQIDPFIELIEKHLVELYPELENKEEDGAKDWACDIINSDSNTEVIETLERIENIIHNQNKNKWVCCVCGENTYNVDCENLSGVDHLSCLLTEEMKSLKNNNALVEVKNQLESLKIYTKQLEEYIQKLEINYNEPTN